MACGLGKKVHEATEDPLLCLKEAVQRRVAHLRHHVVPADTLLARFKTPRGRWTNVCPTLITAHLKATVKLLAGIHLGFTQKDVSAQSPRMALLCSGIDAYIISLIERLRSD